MYLWSNSEYSRFERNPKVETTKASEATPLTPDSDLVSLSDINVRHGFVQKVYGILAFQLILTTIIASLIYHFCQSWGVSDSFAYWAAVIVDAVFTIGVLIFCLCFPEIVRRPPANYGLLLAFTVGESVFVGFISTHYTKESIMIAMAITALIMIGLTIFACQTTYDFTGIGPYLFATLMCLSGFLFVVIIAGLLGLNGTAFQAIMVAFAAAGALVFAMYIVYDTQCILGGKDKKFQFSIDDYCMAAITIYVDIIQLFISILQLVGDRK